MLNGFITVYFKIASFFFFFGKLIILYKDSNMKFTLFMRTMTPGKFLSAEISLVNPWLATDHVCTQHKTNACIYIKKI